MKYFPLPNETCCIFSTDYAALCISLCLVYLVPLFLCATMYIVATAIPDQFRFISHRTTNNANWHHILSKLHPRFMVIVHHPTAVQSNLLAAVPNQTSPSQTRPAQPNPVFSVAAPTATTSLLRCLFAFPCYCCCCCCCCAADADAEAAPSCRQEKNKPKFAIYFCQLTS